ncbi:hypothetical protein UFOVP1470_16 [uncultured Caudovirales phage]|uniref:Uncharacterized protein n=1 Tax=uncultured Caudovirales phage TaxID=2100421 RepID=A0A6J5QAX9_9CAUD|nr:hypothetical protein UFOVP939_10 [uncultured Caudovirales phage]CAB4178558.1 hypothetical protein UFOVP1018_14 [uncultured Caudovirales phage]CAB4183898.1 hypothetical protein UFOVP1105_15 [uncultured Caudovirales phage]CAB4202312.1 hypothetical protein UFOVP1372_5 [uncultured Caudovirales phage]CAB4214989.1 hypothetical protein UFOVP1470_16 [uncultured Caudovirales phage]
MELESSVTIDEGVNAFGIHKQITLEGDQAITKLTYDAAPFIEHAADLRVLTAGDSWGDGHFIGIVPMAEVTRINQTYDGAEERKRQMVLWLKANPKLVTFEKFLK